jgi:glutamate N-acetyltransferase / amino-acid N-acetyltransferase
LIKQINGGVCAPKGYKAAGVACGIKKSGGKDIAVVASKTPAKAAAMFTTNKVKAAPVVISMKNINAKHAGAIVISSGNANACNGPAGLADAQTMCAAAADQMGLKVENVLVASTGIIGSPLPMDKVLPGIKSAVEALSSSGAKAAAEAIMTTDTAIKECAVELQIGQKTVKIGGMAKGVGMIAPNMATMIAVLTTDADICKKALNQAIQGAVETSFNCISIDGDMSTNDTVFVMANGAASNTHILTGSRAYENFQEGLAKVMSELAEKMVRDGEAATKFVKVKVEGANCYADAKAVAMAVADSLLVKCALYGEDANLGRIACAAGSADVDFNPDDMDIYLGNELIMAAGTVAIKGRKKIDGMMKEKDIELKVDLKAGLATATVLTTDLSVGYVKFNAHYRT